MRTPRHVIAGLSFALALTGLAAPAAAQVMRCVDPASGKVTYTDEACAHGEAAREVQPRQSPQEIEQERAQAEQALQRKYQRQQQEAELQRQTTPGPAPSTAAPDPAQTVQCQRARRNLQDILSTADPTLYDDQMRTANAQRQADLACLTPAEYARVQAQRSRQTYAPYPELPGYVPPVVIVPAPHPRPPHQRPPPRREITHCNVFRCYDKNGNTYPR